MVVKAVGCILDTGSVFLELQDFLTEMFLCFVLLREKLGAFPLTRLWFLAAVAAYEVLEESLPLFRSQNIQIGSAYTSKQYQKG